MKSRTLWLITIPRIVLGAIFASAALNYFWSVVFGWMLVPVSITPQAMQFAGEIIKIGYLWPLMKSINLAAAILLIVNRAPAFAVALLLPVTVIIIWFQVFLNPMPIPIATVVLAVVCELLLLHGYARSYAGMFINDKERAGVDAVKVRTMVIVAVAVGAVGAGLFIGMRSGAPVTGVRASSCPYFTPMHGLMPLLFRIGVLPKPPMAASVASSNASTSIVIQPDPNDQIQCAKTSIRAIENVEYAVPQLANGKTTSLKMDLLIPAQVRKRTVVVYVPGGGFVVAGKEGALNLRTYVAEAGFAVASVQYRTTRDGANYRDGVQDIKAAIRYLRASAGKYGIDATTVVLWGESAGGYLAAMVGVTNHDAAFEAGANLNQSSDVQGVIDNFGASDISRIAADFDAATQHAIYTNEGLVQYIGKSPGEYA
jgi:hypothetical protein